MENAADALKIAAFVLIFVLTLTITITSFSEARQVSQRLIEYQDKTYDYAYVDEYKDPTTGKSITERIVGLESIIPTIYRSFLENYKIYFYDENGGELGLYQKTIDGVDKSINFIDLERDDIISFANDTQKEEFILSLLFGNKYGKFKDDRENNIIGVQNYYNTNYKISLQEEGLYGIILKKGNNIKFKEALGEYYQEDLSNQENDENSQSSTPEINKVKKRIITYTIWNEK